MTLKDRFTEIVCDLISYTNKLKDYRQQKWYEYNEFCDIEVDEVIEVLEQILKGEYHG